MMNVVMLIGRLTRDPESRSVGTDSMLTSFTLAIDRTYRKANGEKETDFLNIKTWRKTAELCSKYLHKGSLVAVRGRIQNNNYEDANGVRHYNVDIIGDEVSFLTPRSESEAYRSSAAGAQAAPAYDNSGFGVPMEGFEEIDDMDMPF